MTERGIQIAVAKADLLICRLLALPWGKIWRSLLIAAAVVYVCRKARNERNDAH